MTTPNCLVRLCGSPYYVAPEVISRRPYGQEADMWSAGVITYLILGGIVPFGGSTLAEIFRKVALGEFKFGPPEVWDMVTPEARDLIKRLLQLNPTERLSAEQALESQWFRMDDRLLARRDLTRVRKSLKSFDARMKFRGVVLMVQGAQRLMGAGGGGGIGAWSTPVSDGAGRSNSEEKKEESPV